MDLRPSTQRVFATPEITVAIFLLLPARDLLVNIQRVSKAWQTAIKSPIFQRLLFLEPWPKGWIQDPEFNPLLLEAFPQFFTHASKCDPHHCPPADHWLCEVWPQESLAKTAWARNDESIEAYQRKEASWRKMFPVQPPVKRMDVIKVENIQGDSSTVEGKLLAHHGLTMGVLYDLVEDHVHMEGPLNTMKFDLEWHMFPSMSEVASPIVLNGPRCLASHTRDRANRVTVSLSVFGGCEFIDKDDFLPPKHLRGNNPVDMNEDERLELRIAQSSNARPHLRSFAFELPAVEWEEPRLSEY
jgi:hypothetical protein